MHPLADTLKEEAKQAAALLRQPSEADSTLRMLLADRFYAEKQHDAMLEWLPKVEQRIDLLVTHFESELAKKESRIAELEARLNEPVEMPEAPHLQVVG